VDVADYSDWRLLVCRVDHHLVCGCYSEYHSVREIQQGDLCAVSCFLEQVWVKLDTRRISLQAGQHEGRLTKTVLQETIHSVGVVAPRLCCVAMEIIEASRWSDKNIAIRAPV